MRTRRWCRIWADVRSGRMLGRLGLLALVTGLCVQPSGFLFAHDGTEEPLQAIHPLTIQLLKLHAALGQATPEARQGLFDQLQQTLEARRQALLALIDDHPDVVLEVALPEQAQKAFPASLQGSLEQSMSLEGTLEVTVSSNLDLQVAKVSYALTTAQGERVSLYFVAKGPDLLTDSRVRVRGVKLDHEMALQSADSGSVQTLSAAALAPTAIKTVAVILFNFQNNTTQPYWPSSAKAVTFTNTGGVNAYYQEVSFGKWVLQGKVHVDGDVYGWYTIPYGNATCSTSTWASAARTVAAADGFTTTGYTNVIYAFPSTGACAWWGLGTIGGSPGSAWINGSYALKVVGHELGHNFTLQHSSSYSCTDATGQRVAISTSCTASEYGDPFDIMGTTSSGHVNNYQKGRLGGQGVLDAVNTQDVTTSGVYAIAPLEHASNGTQALRIPRDVDATGKVLRYYYLEFRQPFGFDNTSYGTAASQGVLIRLAPPYATSARPLLLDATPSTSGFTDAALAVGKVFGDPITGITMSTTSVSASGATVEVKFGPVVCALANPSVSLSPSSQWAFAGQPLTYSLTLTNNNTSSCPVASFSLTPTLPAGWSQSPSSASLSVASGAAVTQSFSVTSAADAAPGFYTVTETAGNAADATSTAAASATYNVQPPDTTPPTVTITKPAAGATLRGSSVMIAAGASDASGISRMELFMDGASIALCTDTTSCQGRFSTATLAKGSHSITATATDKAPTPNTGSASITVVK